MNTQISELKGIERQLIALERMHLKQPNPNVVMVARIRGSISVDQLHSALNKVRQKHPLLGVRVKIDNETNAWFTSEGVPELTIRSINRKTNDDWIQIVREEIRSPFSTEKGPLIRFVLLQSSEVSELILVCQHAICDGLALVYLIRDILTYLDSDQEIGSPLIPPLGGKDNLPPSASGKFLAKFFMRLIGNRWNRQKRSFSETEYMDLHQLFWENHDNRILSWSLTELQTSALTTCCQKQQVTVNSALLTAFLAAQQEIQSSQPYLENVVVSVNYRNRLKQPAGEAFAKYASAVRPTLKYKTEEPFWDQARKFNETIDKLLVDSNIFASQQLDNLPSSLLDAVSFNKYGKFDNDLVARLVEQIGGNKINVGIIITNLGKVDIPLNYGFVTLESITGPYVYSDTMEKYLGVITVGGKLHFALSFGENFISANTIEKIKELAMKHLNEAISC
ncbi:MAG: condensation domain-containing protein [Candidatus Hermodarchaeota archaeon]